MNKNHPNAWYSLRRTLPPWKFRETLADLLELAPRFQIDEVIVKIDTEEFSHGHPSLEWAKQYQAMLFEVKERLAELGIVYSLNPWITAGHADRGRNDLERLPGLECMVGHDGSETKHCACFLSPVWRKHIKALWEIYAETRPHIMWVEDDIRTFNHEPVAFGCFCPRHLRMFGERIGRPVERGELVRAMLAPGDAHPWRREYLEMQREIMVETASVLAKTGHAVSPETCLGLMSSGNTNLMHFTKMSRQDGAWCAGTVIAFIPRGHSLPFLSISVKITPSATRLPGQTFFTVTSNSTMRPNDSSMVSPKSTEMAS